jgi:hypothetical protein
VLEIALAVVHLVAAVTCWLLPCSPALALAGTALVVVGFFHTWTSRLHPRGRGTLRRVVWDADGRWWLDVGQRERVAGRLQGEGVALPWCVVLNFYSHGFARHALVLRNGTVDAHTLRRLRARLNTEDLRAC